MLAERAADRGPISTVYPAPQGQFSLDFQRRKRKRRRRAPRTEDDDDDDGGTVAAAPHRDREEAFHAKWEIGGRGEGGQKWRRFSRILLEEREYLSQGGHVTSARQSNKTPAMLTPQRTIYRTERLSRIQPHKIVANLFNLGLGISRSPYDLLLLSEWKIFVVGVGGGNAISLPPTARPPPLGHAFHRAFLPSFPPAPLPFPISHM